MAKLSRDLSPGTPLHPRENLFVSGNLAALNAEVIVDADGSGVVTLDLRGTFSMTVEVSGTIDGTNWILIPMRSRLGGIYLASIVGTTPGAWIGEATGFRDVRARVTAFTSGSAAAALVAESVAFNDALLGAITPTLVTSVGASAAALTLTLPAPGAGLRQYLTYLSINRFAAAALTAAAAPVTVTTTNLPGSLAFSFGADAMAQGVIDRWREDFAYPLMAAAQNTAVTVVCPATTNVIWRATGGYYVGP